MEELQQSMEDVVYACFTGEATETFDSEKLTVLRRGSMQTDLFNVEIAIIGESHFCILRCPRNGRILAIEMLACVDVNELGFKPDTLLAYDEFPTRPSAVGASTLHSELDVVKTEIVSSDCFDSTDGRYDAVDSWMDIPSYMTGNMVALCMNFPGELHPGTFVQVAVRNNVCTIWTVHEYVQEDGVHVKHLCSKTGVTRHLKRTK